MKITIKSLCGQFSVLTLLQNLKRLLANQLRSQVIWSYHHYYYYYFHYYYYSHTRNRCYWDTFKLKTSTGPNSAQLPFLNVIYADFGNGECRPRIGLFTPLKNKFQYICQQNDRCSGVNLKLQNVWNWKHLSWSVPFSTPFHFSNRLCLPTTCFVLQTTEMAALCLAHKTLFFD